MTQNIIIPSKDNKVVLTFAGVDLTLATDIVVNFGAESYSSTLNPTIVVVDSATQLSLDLSSTSEVGQKYITVTYFDVGSTNGTDITSQELGNLGRIIVAIGTQLIIEDGSVVANANSFASDAELKSYADLRGLSFPATQPEREALLVVAMDYLFSIEDKMKGCRVDSAQTLPYPRGGASKHGFEIADTDIPQELKNAQMELAVQANDSDLLISEQHQSLESFNVDGVYSESYFSGGNWSLVRTDKANAYLNSLLKNNGSTGRLVRI